jgi:membrane protease YdiL (CAAX protease family)
MTKHLFWNDQEQRLRAFWRLLLIMLFYGLSLVISIIIIVLLFNVVHLPPNALDYASPLYYLTTFPLYSVLVAAAVLLALRIMARSINHEPFRLFGFQLDRRWWLDLGFGLLVGLVLTAGIFLVELTAGWITITSTFHTGVAGVPFALALFILFITFIGVAVSEETLFRSYPLRNFGQGLRWLGPGRSLLFVWLISCIVFGLAHFSNPYAVLLGLFNIGLAGILFGLSYVLTGRLGLAIGLHIAWDFFLSCIFGIPIAGLTPSQTASLFVINDHGPALWTGGAFGANGGLLGTLAFLLGTILVLLYLRWRYGRLSIYTPLTEYTPVTAKVSVSEDLPIPVKDSSLTK